MTAALGALPGWYSDPSGVASQRYFDGANWTQHTATVLSDTERTDRLSLAVAEAVSRSNARVESQTAFQAVLVYKAPCNHVAWLLAGFFTFGLAWLAWLAAATQQARRLTLRVDPYGLIVWG